MDEPMDKQTAKLIVKSVGKVADDKASVPSQVKASKPLSNGADVVEAAKPLPNGADVATAKPLPNGADATASAKPLANGLTTPFVVYPPQRLPRRSGWRRLGDWIDLILVDHGFLRFTWHNKHRFAEDAWRSNQPTPGRIRAAAEAGIATIINLRGVHDNGITHLEQEACKRYGVELVHFPIRSRAVPDHATVVAAEALFKQIRHPVLIHCKSGADRTGIMAALYLLLYTGSDIDTATAQLSLRYLHLRQSKTGLLDAFLDAYRPYAAQGMSFRHWADNHLDPDAITTQFQNRGWGSFLVDVVLRRE